MAVNTSVTVRIGKVTLTPETKAEAPTKIEPSQTFKSLGVHVTLYNNFLSHDYGNYLLNLLERVARWNHPITSKKRQNANYGDPGISYDLVMGYGDKKVVIRREVHDWKEIPDLILVRDQVSRITGMKYNYVVIQRYPIPSIAMPPHRDKEVASGTIISGVSLGASRNLIINPIRKIAGETHTIGLEHCSLYCMLPPTNDFATHAITPGISGPPVRISLTYRYQ